MNLQDRFHKYFNQAYGHTLGSRFLCAVSGGPDSMVMLDLLRHLQLSISVAHCNFKLRGADSDADEQLVKDYCSQYDIPFFTISFDTETVATKYKTGIQETARKLRYDWFNGLVLKHQFDVILTAHHADDNAETILFNITRGTGMSGASGIPPHTNKIIRPLLGFRKEEIIEHASNQQIPHRTDSSNLSSKYARNIIRNRVIPILEDINPSAISHLNSFGRYCKISSELIKARTQQLKDTYLHQSHNYFILNCKALLSIDDRSFWFFELLKPWGCNQNIVENILDCLLENKTGSYFLTNTHQLMINRQEILIRSLSSATEKLDLKFSIRDLPISIYYNSKTITFEEVQVDHTSSFSGLFQLIDLELAGEHFVLRNWKAGDRFYPLGMNHPKKLSDYFTDTKTNLFEKESALVLENIKEIVAIIGHQISNNVKLTSNSKGVLRISIK